MTVQRLHSALAEVDLLTREELEQTLHREMDAFIRERQRGLDIMRVPFFPITAATPTIQLFATNDQTAWGPDQGDLWMLRRVIVKSTSLTDTARYVAFRGSTPSDTQNAYTTRFLLEGQNPPVAAVTQPVPPAITVGASPFTFVNVQPYMVLVTVSGGTVSSITVNGQSTGATSGTFALTPDTAMVVTYSVAPTMTEVNATANIPALPMGQNVNLNIFFGTKSVFLQPGEQIYAQVSNAVTGNQYWVDGEAIRCPAEMKGKLI